MNNIVTQSRLAMPTGLADLDAGKWKVLVESVFPNAKTVEAVVMAIDYCRARKLDPFKRPVNIVPMWNKSLGREVETVWPGINEVQVTASRTGKYAGLDSPQWGPDVTKTFKGMIKGYGDDGKWEEGMRETTITFPEYCSVTVYRMVEGQRCAFTEPVFWIEAYARRGKSEIPNSMWEKRTKGQLLKVAKAFSLRAAFPEEGEYTAEEMEGKEIEAGGVVIDKKTGFAEMTSGIVSNTRSVWQKAALRSEWAKGITDLCEKAQSVAEIDDIFAKHKARMEEMLANNNDQDMISLAALEQAEEFYKARFNAPANTTEVIPPEVLEDWLEDIANVPTVDGLKHKFSQAQELFKSNPEALAEIINAKDIRKSQLSTEKMPTFLNKGAA